MSTVTLWLLITVGYKNDNVQIVERFATVQECERVRTLVAERAYWTRCVQATIARSLM